VSGERRQLVTAVVSVLCCATPVLEPHATFCSVEGDGAELAPASGRPTQ
jgi:hypothetical protein